MYGTIPQTIQAGQTVRFPEGKFFLLLDTVGDVTITFLGHRNRPLERFENIQPPFSVKLPDGFMGVDIYSATTQTIKIVISTGVVEYSPLVGTVDSDPVIPSSIVTSPDVSLAATATNLIKAANGDRNEIILSNLDGSTTLRVGDANTGAARGTPLAPNGNVILTTTAAVYGYNPSGAAVSVAITEIQ